MQTRSFPLCYRNLSHVRYRGLGLGSSSLPRAYELLLVVRRSFCVASGKIGFSPAFALGVLPLPLPSPFLPLGELGALGGGSAATGAASNVLRTDLLDHPVALAMLSTIAFSFSVSTLACALAFGTGGVAGRAGGALGVPGPLFLRGDSLLIQLLPFLNLFLPIVIEAVAS